MDSLVVSILSHLWVHLSGDNNVLTMVWRLQHPLLTDMAVSILILRVLFLFCFVFFPQKSLSPVWLFVTPWTIQSMEWILQLEWVAFPFSRGSSQYRDKPWSLIEGRFFTSWATREALRCYCSYWSGLVFWRAESWWWFHDFAFFLGFACLEKHHFSLLCLLLIIFA